MRPIRRDTRPKRYPLPRRRPAADSSTHAGIARIEAVTQYARTSFLVLLAYLSFVGVTLMGVHDVDFFSLESSTALPVVNVSVSTSLFFYVAPWLGLFLYAHTHVYHFKLWEALAAAHRTKTDLHLEDRVPPWLTIDFALSLRKNEDEARKHLFRLLTNIATAIFLYAAGPFVLLIFFIWSFGKRDGLLTIAFCAIPLALSLLTALVSWAKLRAPPSEQPPVMPKNATIQHKVKAILTLCENPALHFLNALSAPHAIALTVALALPLSIIGIFKTVETPKLWSVFKTEKTDREMADKRALEMTIADFNWWATPARTDLRGFSLREANTLLIDDEAWEQEFRTRWCSELGLDNFTCGRQLAQDRRDESMRDALHRAWCKRHLGQDGNGNCTRYLNQRELGYAEEWKRAREAHVFSMNMRALPLVDLRFALLSDARLEGANLSGRRMQGVDLQRARLEMANLREASMHWADLSGARLARTDMTSARLLRANLVDARMPGVTLRNARMQRANLRRARIEDNATLAGALLNDADLCEVEISWSDIRGAVFDGAKMQKARLWRVEMDPQTSFLHAELAGASIRAVTVPAGVLSEEQLHQMFGDGSVRLQGIAPGSEGWPPHWPMEELDWDGFEAAWNAWVDARCDGASQP